MTTGVRFGLWLLAIVLAVVAAIAISTFWEPGSVYKDVSVRIYTTEKTCWIVGKGARLPDGTLDGFYNCGSGGAGLTDDATRPASSAMVQKVSENDAEVHARFVVDGEITETAVLTEAGQVVVLSGD